MRPGVRRERAICPACGDDCALTVSGELRRHPAGGAAPCRGAGRRPLDVDVAPPPLVARPAVDQDPVPLHPLWQVPGVYLPAEPMLARSTPCPAGHAAVAILMYVPHDPTSGRSPAEEAAMLYEDPAYLYRVMDTVPNDAIRLALQVPAP